MKDLKKLTHSQFIVYKKRLESGESHKKALKYCLNNKLNIVEYIYKNIIKG